MQTTQFFDASSARPSEKRYAEQQFVSIEEDYIIPQVSAQCDQKDLHKATLQVLEEKFNENKLLAYQEFEKLPIEERMHFAIDQDSGQIFDMRDPKQQEQMYELIGKPVEIKKQEAWDDFIQLSLKMNEYLFDYAELGDLDSIINLLEKSSSYYIDVNKKGLDDWTALHSACQEGHDEIVKVLIKHQANIESVTKMLRTPLFVTILVNQYKCAQTLLKEGASPNCEDIEYNTPLHIAAQYNNESLVELLLQYKANPYAKNSLNQNCIEVAELPIVNIFQKYGYKSLNNEYQRTLIPDRQLIIHNSRSDHISRLLNKNIQNSSMVVQSNPKKEVVRQNKFLNLTKYVNVKFESVTLSPSQFTFYELLGKGSFGEVYLVEKIDDNTKQYAMKILKKDRMISQNLMKYAQTEKNVLSVMDHPFIVKLNYAFQTDSKLFLVMDFCPGGDLSKYLDVRRKLQENEAKIFVAEITLALECLHKNHIIFRDLKPENVVIDKDGHAMLTDFGLSKMGVKDDSSCKSFCGSPAYLAPEILNRQGHNRLADWYVLGVLTYELLVGIPAYYANDREVLFDNIKRGPLKIPKTLSFEAKQFIISLLNRDPSKRLGADRDGAEIREHAWLSDINWEDCYNRKLIPPQPILKQTSKNPMAVNFNDLEESRNKVNDWTFIDN